MRSRKDETKKKEGEEDSGSDFEAGTLGEGKDPSPDQFVPAALLDAKTEKEDVTKKDDAHEEVGEKVESLAKKSMQWTEVQQEDTASAAGRFVDSADEVEEVSGIGEKSIESEQESIQAVEIPPIDLQHETLKPHMPIKGVSDVRSR